MNLTNETISQVVTEAPKEILGIAVPILGNPTFDIFFITIFTSLFITIMNKYFTDQIRIKALRKEMKDMQKQMKKLMSKDPKKAQVMQKEIFKKNMENMKHTMNPKILLITTIPMFALFWFVKEYYSVFGEFLNLGFTEFGWLGTYLVFSIINSIVMKKILDVA